MAGIARVTLIGHLGRDAERRTLPSGTAVVDLTLAVNRRPRDGAEPVTDWYRVSAFGRFADGLARLAEMGGLAKGRQVYVAGRLEPRVYQHQGETRLSLDVIAEEVEALGPRPGGDAAAPRPRDDDFGPGADLGEIPF